MSEPIDKPARVFVVEDSAFALESTRNILKDATDLTYVGYAVNSVEAIVFVREQAPDVVVLDLRLEESDSSGVLGPPKKSIEEGFRALEKIATIAPGLPIIVLTNFAGFGNVQRAFLTGALAVLDKDKISPHDLLTAIRQALRHYVTLHHDQLSWLMAPRSDSLLQLLTPTERTILERVAAGRQLGEIAAETSTALSTIRTHGRNIRRKLNVRRTYDAAIKVGLVHSPYLDEEDDEEE
jgi:DNA-binding NarL/FixJ family response regulator